MAGAPRLLLTRCERLVNRLIAESSPAQRAAQTLEGRTLAVDVAGLDLVIGIGVSGGAVALELDPDAAAVDVRLRATPLELVRLARAESTEELKSARTELAGDVHTAEAFAELMRLARPDLEDELAGWIGDIAAHETAELARGLTAWGRRAQHALELDTAEYLQHEQRLLPAALEVAAFSADVDRLRDDVERAEARLERIAARLEEWR